MTPPPDHRFPLAPLTFRLFVFSVSGCTQDVAVPHVFSAEGFQARREGDRLAEDGPEVLPESHRGRRVHADSGGKPYRGAIVSFFSASVDSCWWHKDFFFLLWRFSPQFPAFFGGVSVTGCWWWTLDRIRYRGHPGIPVGVWIRRDDNKKRITQLKRKRERVLRYI